MTEKSLGETNQSLGLHIISIGTEHLKAIQLTMK